MTTATTDLNARKRELLMMRLKRSAAAVPEGAAAPLPRAPRSAALPLSFAQQRLWFLDQLDSAASAAYHLPGALRLTGRLDQAALQRALDRIVARHETLRTTFASVGGDTVQVIGAPDCGCPLARQDLSHLQGGALEAAVADLCNEEVGRPFSLAAGPLVRARLLRLREDEHILLVTQHHIISDGWSIGVMVGELTALYSAFVCGQPDPLPPLAVQYADYAAWQRGWLQGDLLASQLGFWTAHLGGAPALLAMPTDRPRPAVQSHDGACATLSLPAPLTAGLRALSQRHGTTLFMTMMAGWSALLARMSGQDDIVVGTPVANRQRTELEALIGFFVNTLALRVNTAGDPTVAELLAQVKQSTLGAYAHADLPFEQIVEALKPARSMSYSPVFQVMLSMSNTPGGGDLQLPGLTLGAVEQANVTTQFDLSLMLTDAGEHIVGNLNYATALYDAASMERLMAHFTVLLAGMVANDGARIGELALLTGEQRSTLLSGFNDTAAPIPARLIHQLFETQAAAREDAVALSFEGMHLSYAQLNARANGIAHHLLAIGVKPDDRVALCVERGPDMVAALLGILKAGAGYVPLDPGFPAERLAYMLGDCAPAALVSDAALAATLQPAAGLPLVLLDTHAEAIAARACTNPDVAGLGPSSLAYVIYTSGSTGLPKGVMLEHGSVVNFLASMTDEPGIVPGDSLLAVTTLSFDIAGLELYLPLMNGARIVLASRDTASDAGALAQVIADEGITVMQATPATWRMLLAGGWQGSPTLKVLCGGEALPADLAARLLGCTGELWNVYGPTETTIWSTCRRVTDTVESIGRPIANTQVYILDKNLQPVPIGASGEIFIGGAGVARGYFQRAELTAERFVTDPFSAAPGARMYKTGDVGCWLANGDVAYQGRNDFQVKVRGFRIELGEIEARLAACAGVREAVVMARSDNAQDASDVRLVAYLLANDGVTLAAAELRAALQEHLADYMVPGAFVMLDAFPLTPNNKIDRKALPAPGQDALIQRAYAAPQGSAEQAIAAVWQELLNVAQVGRDDNFFELGGHSLMIVKMLEQLRARGLHAGLRQVFTAPTVAALAAIAATRADAPAALVPPNLIGAGCSAITPAMLPLVTLSQDAIDAAAATVPGGVANIQDIYPLAPLQSGILYHHMMGADSDPYLMRSVLSFDSRALLERFMAALQSVIARHDILRTAMVWKGLATPVQVVYRAAPMSIDELPVAAGADALAALLAHADPLRWRMDLQRAPLLAACIAADAGGACHLALLHHHLVCDHVTLGVINAEIGAFMQGQGAQLAPALPYRDFIAATLRTDRAQHQAYFSALLADIDAPSAPFGLMQVRDGACGQSARVDLDPAFGARIRDGARRHGVTPAVLFHAAWAHVVGQCSGSDNVVFGTVLSGRMQGADGAGRMLGMFINTLPVRFSLAGASAQAVVAEAYRQLTELMVHEQASLALAQRCSGVAAPAPLFTSLLNYRHSDGAGDAAEPPQALSGIRSYAMEERASYPLTVSVDDIDQKFSIAAQCDGVDAARVAAMLAQAVEGLLGALDAAEARTMASIGVLARSEHAQLDAFNATAAAFPREQMIHQVFEAQAAARPHAAALSFEGTDLSYAELNLRANRLAHRLLALGVKADDRVALCMERSVEMIVGLLAILKAGAGYVPLDPAYPAERLALMLDDCAPVALLAQSHLAASLPPCAAPLVLVDIDAAIAAQPGHNPDPAALGLTATSLAYVIYTSGSSGRPNGVMVEHRNVLRLAVNGGFAPIGVDDCIAHCASPSFDASTWEIWGALLNGARVLLVPQPVLLDPQRFSQCLIDGGATALWLTAGLFNEYVDALAPAFARLTYLMAGGDALDPRTVRRALEREQRPRHLINGYGPTECTTFATTFAIEAVPARAASLPIGRPIGNTSIYILDSRGQKTPLGVAGEIHIGGLGVARGYLNRPQLTAQRFLADPFSSAPNARMYKSGDLGRWLPDGTVEYLGRNDFQVKIRGFRIELGEIEAKLAACAGVREAVVLAREDQPGEKRLVAYLIAQDGATLAPAALRTELAASLADYMLPGAFVTLAAFPLTPNGKLDRRALPAPDQAAAASRAYAAPQGALECAIAAIWQDLLGLEQVGRDDDFFELGGHSLMVVQMVGRIRQSLGIEVNLRELFSHPTLAAFAQAAGAALQSQHTAIARADRGAALPLSFAQQRLWFLDQLDPAAGAAYHIPAALRLSGALDKAALRATLDAIVARHENLRTSFVAIDGNPAQVIAPAQRGFALTETDLAHLPRAQQDSAVAEIGAAEAAGRFDLATGPLVRGQLLRLDEQEHILLVTQHHIVSDGWSIGVLVREMSALYAAFSTGAPDPLPALAIQYADYAAWQRGWLQGAVLEAQTDFWRAHLGGAPALLEMPSDRPRPALQSHAGASASLSLSPQLSAALRALGQRHGTTLFMTLLAGWALLLARVSGQGDVVVGTPVANRQRAETEPLIGFFVNTLALRVRLHDGLSVAALLAQVKASTLGAYEHQDLPFDQVVDALQPARSLSYSPLFQAMLSMNTTPRGAGLNLSGLEISGIEQARNTAHFDLSLALADDGTAIGGSLTYASALFDAASMARLLGQFEMLLGAMAADSAQPVARLPLLTAPELHQLTEQFNDTACAYPREQLVHALFEAQARATPHAAALECEGQVLSYAQLNARANQLAHHLLALGVRPDQRVAVCLERSLEMVIALLGIMKAGAGYVPLDPAYPAERLAFMLDDSAPAVLLTQASLSGALHPACAVVLLDAHAGVLAQQPDGNPDPAQLGLHSGHLAYVIYTSGSTGLPKGVMVEHRSVINLWQGLARSAFLHVPAQARIGFNAAISFDASVKNIVQLLSGHCLVLIPQALRADAGAMLDWFRAQRIDMFDCTPSQLEAMCQAGLLDDAALRKCVIVIGGEAIGSAAWQGLQQAGVRAYNVYGPTECTVDATLACIAQAGPAPHIGHPLPNTRIYILDGLQQPVPLGATGEIYIGGAGVARGYLKRAELTAERFLADPFSGIEGARMYRTGDLGRWQADGSIAYLGRNDFQVKLRGHRIELGEIEAALAACEGVAEAVVVARTQAAGDMRLVAYLVARCGATLQASALRAALLARLADYMVPAAFVVLDAFPLTPNNKLDRKALPAPDQDAVVTRAWAAPQGELETVVAAVWQQLLGLERVGRDDHFFELGGHSLMAVQVVARLRQALGIEASLRELFSHPVLRDFARQAGAAARSTQGAIAPADRGAALPLSFAQQRLWFLDQLDHSAGAAFHMPSGLRLSGQLNEGALARALDAIVARHESLRTTFARVAGQAVQVFADPGCGFALRRHDLSHLGGHEQASALALAATDEMSAPFSLEHGPLVRGQLLRLGEQEHVLLVTQHHIVSDGWSTGVLVRELCALYAAFCDGRADPLAPLPIQYADYAAWQRSWLSGAVLEAQTAFWTEHLAGAPALLELPADRPRPAAQSFAGGSVELVLSPELSAGARALGQRHGATLFMTLLAAWSAVLARLSGQDDVVIGTPVANRQRAETENLIGFFVNTLALRVRPEAQLDVAALLAQVKASTLGAFEHQDLPFDLVVEALKPVRSMSYGPLFQVLFSLNNTPPGAAMRLPGLELAPLGQESAMCQFDLVLSLSDSGGQIGGSLGYASDLFDHATVERFAVHFQTLLAGMVADEHRQLAALPLLDAAQRRQLLEGFNASGAAFPAGQLAHQLFEEQAARHPEALALLFEEQRISYAQLNRRANQVAHSLIALGVRPDDRVALCLERGPDLIVGMLGIMKAGGAYVPLDPAYPLERRQFMLGDCAPRALLTQALLGEELCGPGAMLPVLRLDADAAALAAQPGANPDPRQLGLDESHLAYVIYTSGSTGMPKGVQNQHSGLVNLIHAQQAEFCIAAGDRVLQFVSASFDVCVSEVTMALCNGACLALASSAALQPGAPLLATLRTLGATHLVMPSAVLAALDPDADLGQVHTLVAGGDAMPPALADHWSSRLTLYNAYGPTEAAVAASMHRCAAPHGRVVPIGRPGPNVRIYLLDALGQPVALGMVGELHIGGVQVARGYLNRDELTAERFLPDPFAPLPGGRMYKTGDLARWLPDGNLESVGRNDFQVKIRGFRIELGEIETRLAACAGVHEALVLARQDGPGEKRLVAYVVARDGAALVPGALRAELAAQLPAHMVPGAVVLMDAFPRTANGKHDRKALPAPELAGASERDYVAPEGAIESALAAIWQSLLGLQRVGRDDSFFELGGHSLMAVQVMARVEQELGIEASLRELFVQPTLRGFAGVLRAQAPAKFHSLVPIRPDGILKPLFLIHPGEGEVGYARNLAPCLDPQLPVYALAAQGFARGETPLATVEEMAACYIGQMRQVQPHGPYRVAGWSAGGTIAWEVANQLIGADERVEFLGMIDTSSTYQALAGGIFGMQGTVMNDFEAWICTLAWLPADAPATVRESLARLAETDGADALLAAAQAAGLLPAQIGVPMLRRHLAVRHGIATAMFNYVRPAIPVPVSLFAASGARRADASLGWAAALGQQLRMVAVPGDHYSAVEAPNVAALGRAIDAEMAAASLRVPDYAELNYSPKVAIQFGRRDVAPLFCVPGAGASVTAFTDLAQTLDPSIPVYGLQPRGLCGTMVPHIDVQSAARAYIKTVREVQPKGPYRLLGHSYGGWVVTEMARQLAAAGERISTLVVLDSQAPATRAGARKHYKRVEILMRLVGLFEDKLQRSLCLEAADFDALGHDAQLQLLLERLIEAGVLPPRTRLQTLRGIVRAFGSNVNTRYEPEAAYEGELHLAAASHEPDARIARASPDELIATWRRQAPQAHLWTSKGNHMTLLARPHIHELGNWLSPLMKAL